MQHKYCDIQEHCKLLVSEKSKMAKIKKLCTENLKYRLSAGAFEPTKATRVLEHIINIIDKGE